MKINKIKVISLIAMAAVVLGSMTVLATTDESMDMTEDPVLYGLRSDRATEINEIEVKVKYIGDEKAGLVFPQQDIPESGGGRETIATCISCYVTCWGPTCESFPTCSSTCWPTCGGTCWPTCGETCWTCSSTCSYRCIKVMCQEIGRGGPCTPSYAH